MQSETWSPISGYESVYSVSNFGRIRRDRHSRCLSLDKGRYVRVCLSRSGVKRKFVVHRLVATAFIGSVEGLEVNHLNGDKHDNRVSNLEICTRRENQAHAREVLGYSKGGGKFTEQDIIDIHAQRNAGHVCSKIAQVYGVDESTIAKIARGYAYRDLTMQSKVFRDRLGRPTQIADDTSIVNLVRSGITSVRLARTLRGGTEGHMLNWARDRLRCMWKNGHLHREWTGVYVYTKSSRGVT